jgi:hypothetical protein
LQPAYFVRLLQLKYLGDKSRALFLHGLTFLHLFFFNVKKMTNSLLLGTALAGATSVRLTKKPSKLGKSLQKSGTTHTKKSCTAYKYPLYFSI